MVEINVSDVHSRGALHAIIAKALNFPDYYVGNWDAFDECSTDPDLSIPSEVRVVVFCGLAERLPNEARLMRQCFEDRHNEGRIRVVWADDA